MRACRMVASMILLLSSAVASAAPAQALSRADRIKAAFLLHFTRYVEWPEGAFEDQKAPIVIAVIDNRPFANFLERVVQGRTSQGRTLAVRHYDDVESAEGHVLFCGDDAAACAALSEREDRHHWLTVGEKPGFLRHGVVRLFVVSNRMRFAINLDMARAHGLNISSRLLDLAQYVLSSEALARTVPVSEGDPVTDRKSAGPAE